eukprot:Hpha_TRINITY_DN16411_c2_g5::TRINITY_DN16411_c2_g5_i2::g.161692::m.161692
MPTALPRVPPPPGALRQFQGFEAHSPPAPSFGRPSATGWLSQRRAEHGSPGRTSLGIQNSRSPPRGDGRSPTVNRSPPRVSPRRFWDPGASPTSRGARAVGELESGWRERCLRAEARASSSEVELTRLREDAAGLRRELVASSEKHDSLRRALEQECDRRNGMERELLETSRRKTDAEDRAVVVSERAERNGQELSNAASLLRARTADLASARERIAELESQLTEQRITAGELRVELGEAQMLLTQAGSTRGEKQWAPSPPRAEAKLREAEARVEIETQRRRELAEELATLDGMRLRCSAVESRCDALRQREANLTVENEQAQQRNAELSKRLATCEAATGELQVLRTQMDSMRADLAKERARGDSLEDELLRGQTRMQEMQRESDRLGNVARVGGSDNFQVSNQEDDDTAACLAKERARNAELEGQVEGLKKVLETRKGDIDNCVETNRALEAKMKDLERNVVDQVMSADNKGLVEMQLQLKAELIERLEGQLARRADQESELHEELDAEQKRSKVLERELEIALSVRRELEARMSDINREAASKVFEAEARAEAAWVKGERNVTERDELDMELETERLNVRRLVQERSAAVHELGEVREALSQVQKERVCGDVEIQELRRAHERDQRTIGCLERRNEELRKRLLESERGRRQSEAAATIAEGRLTSESQSSQQQLDQAAAVVEELRRGLAERGHEVGNKQRELEAEHERLGVAERRWMDMREEQQELRQSMGELEATLTESRAELYSERAIRKELSEKCATLETQLACAKGASEATERLLRQEGDIAAQLRGDLSHARSEIQLLRRQEAVRAPAVARAVTAQSATDELVTVKQELARCCDELRQRRRGDDEKELGWRRRVAHLEQKASAVADAEARRDEAEKAVVENRDELMRVRADLTASRREAAASKERILELQSQLARKP